MKEENKWWKQWNIILASDKTFNNQNNVEPEKKNRIKNTTKLEIHNSMMKSFLTKFKIHQKQFFMKAHGKIKAPFFLFFSQFLKSLLQSYNISWTQSFSLFFCLFSCFENGTRNQNNQSMNLINVCLFSCLQC